MLQNLLTPLNKLRCHIHLIDVISRVWVFSFISSSQKWKHNFIALGGISLKFYQSQN